MEHKGSLPHSQVPATCPYPKPHRTSPCPHNPLPEDPSLYNSSIYACVSQVVSFPQVSAPKPLQVTNALTKIQFMTNINLLHVSALPNRTYFTLHLSEKSLRLTKIETCLCTHCLQNINSYKLIYL